jgi:hypothetical protein
MQSRSLRFLEMLRSLVGLLGFLLGFSMPASAQAPMYTLGANAGVAAPAGDLSSFTSMGYTVAATVGVHHPLIPLGLRAEASWMELPWSDDSGVRRRIYGFAVDGTANFGTVATNGGGLYITGGVGYFGWKDTGGLFDTITLWNVGFNAGLGYYLPLSRFAVSLEGRYESVLSSTSQGMFPITVGVTF